MTKIVLKMKKDVSGEQAESIKHVLKKALTDYLAAHVPVEKNVQSSLKAKDPKSWHRKMAEVQRNIDACLLLINIKVDEIEVTS